MRFEFATAGRILFGPGTLSEAGEIAAGLGRRPLLVTGSTSERARTLLPLLVERGLDVATFSVSGEPDVETVRRGTAAARDRRCDSVIGFGGGAALDAAKAIAVMAANPGDVVDYLEIIGHGKTLSEPSLPCLAIPTTAGTGSEVTRNSVIASREHRVKVSLRSPFMLPRVALVDPELTYGLPAAITAASGMDALTQVIEPFVCKRANPFTDGLCQEGIVRAARALRPAFAAARTEQARAPEDMAAREDMAVTSLFGGLALANAGLGAVHGIAGPAGGMVGAPHGALCAALLPAAVKVNLRAMRAREPQNPAIARYARVAQLLTGDQAAEAEAAPTWLRRLATDLEIPGLGSYGVDGATISELVENAARASSMRANPVELSREELAEIIEMAR
jgi:alcohol dehydrogenase class IV